MLILVMRGFSTHVNDPFFVEIVSSPASQAEDDLWGAETASAVAIQGVHRSPVWASVTP